jgi:hypothetical protein
MVKGLITFRIVLIFCGCLLLLASDLEAQGGGSSATYEDTLEVYEDLFGREDVLNMTLKSDFKTFKRTRTKDIYLPADMTCIVSDSFQVTHPVRLKARGIYRKAHCAMPPIWLNIRYAGIETRELAGIRKMKMVTICRSGDQYMDFLLRECLVYKIYNLLTPYSYRVRLINLKMVDTGRGNKETSCWAFLIEPGKLMAKRLGAKVIKNDKLSMRTVNQEAMDRLAMFQYMIGNPDYSVTGRHNLKILDAQTLGSSDFIPVPYDFDFTGIVNASYAMPNQTLPIGSVKERYFVGPCRDRASYESAIAALEAIRDEIESTIWAFDYLDEEDRFDMIGYVESFFNTADNEHFIDREISKTCK